MNTIIEPQRLVMYLHHVIKNDIISETDVEFFSSHKDIQLVYSIVKNLYDKYGKIDRKVVLLELNGTSGDIDLLKRIYTNDTSYIDMMEKSPDYLLEKFKEDRKAYDINKRLSDIMDARKNPKLLESLLGMKEDEEVVVEKDSIRKFPLSVFPMRLQKLILDLEKKETFDIDFSATSIMSVVAGLAGNKYKLDIWNSPPLFWFAQVGDPGSKKSHPLSTIIKPVEHIDGVAFKAITDDSKSPKQVILYNSTIEALNDLHHNNPRGLIYYKDELVAMLKGMNQYKSGLGDEKQQWLSSFNNNTLVVNRVSKKTVRIENVMINIVGTIQIDHLVDMMNSENDGMTDRFLYTRNVTGIKPLTLEHSSDILNDFSEIISKIDKDCIYNDYKDIEKISINPKLNDIYLDTDRLLCRYQSYSIPQRLISYIEKLKTYYPRFVLLLSLIDFYFDNDGSEDKPSICKDNITNAKKLCLYFLRTYKDILNQTNKLKEIKDISKNQSHRGMSNKERILEMHNKGIKNTDIAKELKITKQAVGQTIKKNK